MATINVYDEDTNTSRRFNIEIDSAFVKDGGEAPEFYIKVSTSERTPSGKAIEPVIITDLHDDGSPEEGISRPIKDVLADMMGQMVVDDDESSESSESSG